MFRKVFLFGILAQLVSGQSGTRARFLPDDPIRATPAPIPVETVRARKLSDTYDYFLNEFGGAGEVAAKPGNVVRALGVNTIGEVPDGDWYESRHYDKAMSLEELVRGPGNREIPAEGPWTVVAAKNEGVTPGFTVVDANRRRWVIKFDPTSNPELATAADVISSKFFHALGYHVPHNEIVFFERSRLVLGEDTQFVDTRGIERKMTGKDLGDVFLNVPKEKNGQYRAVASLYLTGRPVGPHRYHGTRRDDPNDSVPHEHRRDLRGLRVLCAWLGHEDSRAINTLDMLVRENGVQFVKHYLIDFGSTLGSASTGPNSPRSGNEEFFSWGSSAAQFASLGLYVPRWARAKYPNLPSVGLFEHEVFDPEAWTPEYRNPAFENMLPDDAFWAARQVMAFTDEQIRAIVKTGQYSDPRAEAWVTECLIRRRDKIGKAYFGKVLPLDRFAVQKGELRFEDLAASHKLAEARRIEVRWAEFDNHTGARPVVANAAGPAVPSSRAQFLVATLSAEAPRQAVDVFLRRVGQGGGEFEVVGVERSW